MFGFIAFLKEAMVVYEELKPAINLARKLAADPDVQALIAHLEAAFAGREKFTLADVLNEALIFIGKLKATTTGPNP